MPPFVFFIPLAGIAAGAIVMVTAMNLISKHISERRRSSLMPSDDIVRRLERIESTLDATALEVERIAEANRFVAKLLAEKSSAK